MMAWDGMKEFCPNIQNKNRKIVKIHELTFYLISDNQISLKLEHLLYDSTEILIPMVLILWFMLKVMPLNI